MDKRVIVFLMLSLVIILGFDLFLRQMGWLPEPPPAQDGSAQTPSSSEGEPTPAPAVGKDNGSSVPTQSGTKSSASASGMSLPSLEQTVTVETNLVRVELSNRGG